jgi:FkbM family methyltransferase
MKKQSRKNTRKHPEKTREIKFNQCVPDNEIVSVKCTGNLKTQIKFITPDIFLNENSIIFDIGANIGKFTSIFNRYGCEIHAFEPTMCTYKILSNRFSKCDNVKCINKACYTQNTSMQLYHHEFSRYNDIYWSHGNSLLNSKINVDENDYETIECIDLAQYILEIANQKHQNIDFIKMDIEGAEIDVINHLIDTGAIHKVNVLICETHEKKINCLKSSTETLKAKVVELQLSHKIFFNWI